MASGLSDQETERMMSQGEGAGDTVLLVELDPHEGSGVIPGTWSAILTPLVPSGESTRSSRGVSTPSLVSFRGLSGAARRDYDNDVYWIVFAFKTETGQPLFIAEDGQAELTGQIHGTMGKVHWAIPDSFRNRLSSVH